MRGSVKVDKDLLVSKLEAKLVELKKEYAVYEAAQEKYKKAREAWIKKAAAYLVKHGELEDVTMYHHRSVVEVHYKNADGLPTKPEESDFHDSSSQLAWRNKGAISEIEEFLKVMSITADDKVSMAVINNLSQYL